MKIFQTDKINSNPYWGYFENRELAAKVTGDLSIALSDKVDNKHPTTARGDYVIAFRLQDQLYVSKRGFNAVLISDAGVWYPNGPLDRTSYPNNGVLVLSAEYFDDLPNYTDPTSFCKMVDSIPMQAYCIKLTKSTMPTDVFNTIDYNNFHKVSPFELKNTLISKAKDNTRLPLLNVGRGNPNFMNTVAREAFAHLLLFSSQESRKIAEACYDRDCTSDKAIGFAPKVDGLFAKLQQYTLKLKTRGGQFLHSALEWMVDNYIIPEKDDLAHQLVIATLGSFYPDPPHAQPFVSACMNAYMDYILLHKDRPRGKFDVFMTEGATGGIMYTFKSLRINGLLNPGDTIAIITPIFTPYLELPELSKYDLKEVYITGDENNDWKIPFEQLDKLRDPKIKALFLVNPTNPSAVSMTEEHVKYVGEIVNTDNPNLIIIADSVYAPFVESYNSFMSHAPKNTIEMYSFSKYFGVTGWRMGMIVMHPNNVIDNKLLFNLSNSKKKELDQRYSIVTETGQEDLSFMQRLVLDSRDVAEAHTGGLATPQQALMCLFAIYDMTHPEYKPSIKKLLRERIILLYEQFGFEPPLDTDDTDYYTIVDIKKLATQRYGADFIPKLVQRDCLEFVFRLAMDYSTICLPIAGFHGPCWAIRISLANAPTSSYTKVGENIVAVLNDMHKAYN